MTYVFHDISHPKDDQGNFLKGAIFDGNTYISGLFELDLDEVHQRVVLSQGENVWEAAVGYFTIDGVQAPVESDELLDLLYSFSPMGESGDDITWDSLGGNIYGAKKLTKNFILANQDFRGFNDKDIKNTWKEIILSNPWDLDFDSTFKVGQATIRAYGAHFTDKADKSIGISVYGVDEVTPQIDLQMTPSSILYKTIIHPGSIEIAQGIDSYLLTPYTIADPNDFYTKEESDSKYVIGGGDLNTDKNPLILSTISAYGFKVDTTNGRVSVDGDPLPDRIVGVYSTDGTGKEDTNTPELLYISPTRFTYYGASDTDSPFMNIPATGGLQISAAGIETTINIYGSSSTVTTAGGLNEVLTPNRTGDDDFDLTAGKLVINPTTWTVKSVTGVKNIDATTASGVVSLSTSFDVVDDLTSISVTDVLSANQGREILELIGDLEKVVIRGPYTLITNIPTPYSNGVIYLVGAAPPYSMYILIDGQTSLTLIGQTEVDLSDYYNTAESDARFIIGSGNTNLGKHPLYITTASKWGFLINSNTGEMKSYATDSTGGQTGNHIFRITKDSMELGDSFQIPPGGGANFRKAPLAAITIYGDNSANDFLGSANEVLTFNRMSTDFQLTSGKVGIDASKWLVKNLAAGENIGLTYNATSGTYTIATVGVGKGSLKGAVNLCTALPTSAELTSLRVGDIFVIMKPRGSFFFDQRWPGREYGQSNANLSARLHDPYAIHEWPNDKANGHDWTSRVPQAIKDIGVKRILYTWNYLTAYQPRSGNVIVEFYSNQYTVTYPDGSTKVYSGSEASNGVLLEVFKFKDVGGGFCEKIDSIKQVAWISYAGNPGPGPGSLSGNTPALALMERAVPDGLWGGYMYATRCDDDYVNGVYDKTIGWYGRTDSGVGDYVILELLDGRYYKYHNGYNMKNDWASGMAHLVRDNWWPFTWWKVRANDTTGANEFYQYWPDDIPEGSLVIGNWYKQLGMMILQKDAYSDCYWKIIGESEITPAASSWGEITGNINEQTDLWDMIQVGAGLAINKDTSTKKVTLSYKGKSAVWGAITGNINEQTDLNTVLLSKLTRDTSWSGDYTPTPPYTPHSYAASIIYPDATQSVADMSGSTQPIIMGMTELFPDGEKCTHYIEMLATSGAAYLRTFVKGDIPKVKGTSRQISSAYFQVDGVVRGEEVPAWEDFSGNDFGLKYVDTDDYSKGMRIFLDDGVRTVVVDNLQSTSSTSALSAKQGGVLAAMVAGIGGYAGPYAKIEQLPTTGDSKKIYLVGKYSPYEIYVWMNDQQKYIQIGSTEIDLSDYYNKTEIDDMDWLTKVGAVKVGSLYTGIKFTFKSREVIIDIHGDAVGIDANAGMSIKQYIGDRTVDVIDNLTTQSSTSALSAKQGYVLKGLIDGATTNYYTKTQVDAMPWIASVTIDLVNNLTKGVGFTKHDGTSQGVLLTGDKINITTTGNKSVKTYIDDATVMVVDDVTTESSTSALSAKQGFLLENIRCEDNTLTDIALTFSEDSSLYIKGVKFEFSFVRSKFQAAQAACIEAGLDQPVILFTIKAGNHELSIAQDYAMTGIVYDYLRVFLVYDGVEVPNSWFLSMGQYTLDWRAMPFSRYKGFIFASTYASGVYSISFSYNSGEYVKVYSELTDATTQASICPYFNRAQEPGRGNYSDIKSLYDKIWFEKDVAHKVIDTSGAVDIQLLHPSETFRVDGDNPIYFYLDLDRLKEIALAQLSSPGYNPSATYGIIIARTWGNYFVLRSEQNSGYIIFKCGWDISIMRVNSDGSSTISNSTAFHDDNYGHYNGWDKDNARVIWASGPIGQTATNQIYFFWDQESVYRWNDTLKKEVAKMLYERPPSGMDDRITFFSVDPIYDVKYDLIDLKLQVDELMEGGGGGRNTLQTSGLDLLSTVSYQLDFTGTISGSQGQTVTTVITVPKGTEGVDLQLVSTGNWGDSQNYNQSIVKTTDTTWTITCKSWNCASATRPAQTLTGNAFCYGKDTKKFGRVALNNPYKYSGSLSSIYSGIKSANIELCISETGVATMSVYTATTGAVTIPAGNKLGTFTFPEGYKPNNEYFFIHSHSNSAFNNTYCRWVNTSGQTYALRFENNIALAANFFYMSAGAFICDVDGAWTLTPNRVLNNNFNTISKAISVSSSATSSASFTTTEIPVGTKVISITCIKTSSAVGLQQDRVQGLGGDMITTGEVTVDYWNEGQSTATANIVITYEPKGAVRMVEFPIGYVYMSTGNTNPSVFFRYGTWEAFGQGKVLVGVDSTDTDFNASMKTGGAKEHTLTVAQMPSHKHPIATGANDGSSFRTGGTSAEDKNTGSVGGGEAHNNLQPYITVYMFRRTA